MVGHRVLVPLIEVRILVPQQMKIRPCCGGFLIWTIKICPHYKQEYKGKLDGVGIGLEELCLPEYQFKAFEK